MTIDERIVELERQDEHLVLPHFDQTDAWRLGRTLADRALDEGLPLLIDIRQNDRVLFRAALPGTTLDQQFWAERKAALVERMDASSALVEARMARDGIDPVAVGWLDHRYAVTGGAVPMRVAGAGRVAVATASGLTSTEDHDYVLRGLTELIAEFNLS